MATEATTENWRERFLHKFAERANVTEAARYAGINRQYAYRVRGEDASFREAWDSAEQEAVDRLEKIAFQRASSQSDTLLIFLLKAHRRERYGDCLSINVIKRVQRELETMDDADLLAMMGYEQSREPAAG